MKRSYISPEFKYTKVNGTLNMIEQTNFFGSKMMDIEDNISIDNNDVIYYQRSNGEQINLTQELLLPNVIYSNSNNKFDNHTLSIDPNQSEFQKLNNCNWKLRIDIKTILNNYIYAKIKNARSFEGVLSSNTKDNSVNSAISDYITTNIYNRYEYVRIELFLKYNSLVEDGNFQSPDNNTILDTNIEQGNNWNVNINNEKYIEDKIQGNVDYDQTYLNVSFKQGEKRSDYNFDYYFNIYFNRK